MPDPLHGSIPQRLQCLLGLAVFIGFAWLIGRWRTRGQVRGPFPWRTLGWGVALQFIFALLVLRTPNLLVAINAAIDALLGFTRAGARMVFGNLADPLPVTATPGGAAPVTGYAQTGAYFAFFVLPRIIFFSCLTAIAYHLGILQL